MKKLSYKDLIIALGVLVAVVIILTSIYFKGTGEETRSMKITPEKKVKPAAIFNTLRKFTAHTSF